MHKIFLHIFLSSAYAGGAADRFEYPRAIKDFATSIGQQILLLYASMNLSDMWFLLLPIALFGALLLYVLLKSVFIKEICKLQGRTNIIVWKKEGDRFVSIRRGDILLHLLLLALGVTLILFTTFIICAHIRHGIYPGEEIFHVLFLIGLCTVFVLSLSALILSIKKIFSKEVLYVSQGGIKRIRSWLVFSKEVKLSLSEFESIQVRLYKGQSRFGSYLNWSVVLKHSNEDSSIQLYIPVTAPQHGTYVVEKFLEVPSEIYSEVVRFKDFLGVEKVEGQYRDWIPGTDKVGLLVRVMAGGR